MTDRLGIPIPDLPEELTAVIHGHIRLFSVTVVVRPAARDAYSCAGTLCRIASVRGILTARHVWEKVRTEPEIQVLAGRAHVSVAPQLVQAVSPAPKGCLPETVDTVPDIAFLPLSDHDCTRLEAYGKTFFSVDRRLTQPDISLYDEDGYFALYGAPQARLNVERRSAASFIYGTGISKRFEFEGWDYLDVALNLEFNPELPTDFSGVSGGGIWRTPFWTTADASQFEIENRYRDIMLIGVNFRQTSMPNRSIFAHGPRSIYECMRREVAADGA